MKFISLRITSAALVLLLLGASGCGTFNTRSATEQLIVSDAVDRSVSGIDFSGLAGQSVFLDTRYIQPIKGIGFVNADYIISSLRQQMLAHGCLLESKADDAEFVVEARVGALGTDGSELTVGIPQNDVLTSAGMLVPSAPILPSIPEIAFAKRNANTGAAKIAVFAYHQKSKQPVWQSGTSVARSDSKDTWILGAGPFQGGSIYQGTHFAGEKIGLPKIPMRRRNGLQDSAVARSKYFKERFFGPPDDDGDQVRLVDFEESTEESKGKD